LVDHGQLKDQFLELTDCMIEANQFAALPPWLFSILFH